MKSGKDRDEFFVRQNVKLRHAIKPSEDPDRVRLKFFEFPYRLLHKVKPRMRTTIYALIATIVIPVGIYKTVLFFVKFEVKSKLKAGLGENADILDYLEKVRLK